VSKRAVIFEAFFSTKGSSGTGLGLAVSQKLIQEHGGTIAVDSCEGAWTEFRIALPVGTPAAAPAQTG
jgi:signal transduction histidine kinase